MEITQQYNQQSEQEISYKKIKDAMKSDIKKMETEQRETKKGRKSTDPYTQSLSQATHAVNRYTLRHSYIAYHQFRKNNSSYSKSLSSVKEGTIINQDLVDKIIAKYASKTVHINKG